MHVTVLLNYDGTVKGVFGTLRRAQSYAKNAVPDGKYVKGEWVTPTDSTYSVEGDWGGYTYRFIKAEVQ